MFVASSTYVSIYCKGFAKFKVFLLREPHLNLWKQDFYSDSVKVLGIKIGGSWFFSQKEATEQRTRFIFIKKQTFLIPPYCLGLIKKPKYPGGGASEKMACFLKIMSSQTKTIKNPKEQRKLLFPGILEVSED